MRPNTLISERKSKTAPRRPRLMGSRNLTHSGQQYELLQWLSDLTFPTEAKFADLDYAKKTYTSVVQRVLNNGVRLAT